MKPLNLIDRLLLALVVTLAACCAAGCTNADVRPRMDRDAVIALVAPNSVLGLDVAIEIWAAAGVRFERCAAGIPIVIDPNLSADKLGEYEWDALGPKRIVLRFDDATVLAHELGHVLGLEHLADEDVGLMSWTPLADELTHADMIEYERSGR